MSGLTLDFSGISVNQAELPCPNENLDSNAGVGGWDWGVENK